MRSFLLLCNLLPLSLLTEWSESLETCIICNGYHSLMVPVLPLADHNGPFSRLSESPSVSLIVTEWGRHVTWEETRGTMGPSFTCQEAGIKVSWHGAHTENGTRWQLQCSKKNLPFGPRASLFRADKGGSGVLLRLKKNNLNMSKVAILSGYPSLFWFDGFWARDQLADQLNQLNTSRTIKTTAGLKVHVLWLILPI